MAAAPPDAMFPERVQSLRIKVAAFSRPPPRFTLGDEGFPLLILKPDMFTVVPAAILNTRTVPFPLTESWLAPRPVMVTLLESCGKAEPRMILCPGRVPGS